MVGYVAGTTKCTVHDADDKHALVTREEGKLAGKLTLIPVSMVYDAPMGHVFEPNTNGALKLVC